MEYNQLLRNVMMVIQSIEMVAPTVRQMMVFSVKSSYYSNHFVTNVKINAVNAPILILKQFVNNALMDTFYKIIFALYVVQIVNTANLYKFVLSVQLQVRYLMKMGDVLNVSKGNNYKMAFVRRSVGTAFQGKMKYVISENKMAQGGTII